MHISLLPGLIALLVAASGAFAAPVQEQPVSEQARSVFERSRDSVAQIRVLLGRSDSHTATGTGFVVGAGGLLLTNYHVVSDKALEPETYRLEFVLPNGRRGELQILAVDVTHDLAVVKGDVGDARPLALRERSLAKGDKAFSLGYPLSQGLTVTEGTYNGRSEDQYYEQFHFTGALNPGMSGGPALDTGGMVFGINVASHLGGQLVNFLVPAKYGKALLARAAAAPAAGADFQETVGTQLRAHGDELMRTLLKTTLAVEKLGESSVPGKIGSVTQCSAATERETEKLYTVDSYQCYTRSSLYIDGRLYTGSIWFRHRILESTQLGALRFAHLQEVRFESSRGSPYDRKHHTRYACRDQITNIKGTRAKMVICARGYKRFAGLYDVVVKFATVDNARRALQSELTMEGVPFQPALDFANRYLEAIEWNP